MLFAVAFCSVMALVIHRRGKRLFFDRCRLARPRRRNAGKRPAPGLGGAGRGGGDPIALTPWSASKRRVMRAAVAVSDRSSLRDGRVELQLFDLRAGAHHPIHRRLQADPSTMWRDLENYNLFLPCATIHCSAPDTVTDTSR